MDREFKKVSSRALIGKNPFFKMWSGQKLSRADKKHIKKAGIGVSGLEQIPKEPIIPSDWWRMNQPYHSTLDLRIRDNIKSNICSEADGYDYSRDH